uniref:(California timema) hypothetical protein n=1 Tax=Timema californicum TaxID=61474 RepID=A0A7R9J2S9_TIMCA|nr:unnamed protein product [Timema californicum]
MYKKNFLHRSGDWELIGEGEKETPRHKLQRLQCEMRELCEELAHRKESVKDEKSQDQKEMVFLANQLEQAEKQLADIKLEEILGTELVANLADPQEAQLKKALSLIEDLKRGGDNFGDAKNVAVLDQKEITFQLNYRPEHARFSQTTRLAELEQRLHKMEAVLGMEPQKLTRLSLDSQRRSLLEVAESLSARANLLDSAQLDHIEGRLIALTQNMDSLAEKTGTCEDADKQRKVVELYEMVKKTETLSQVLPQVLERMTALDHLHQQAANISKSLTQLEDLQQHITSGLDNNESLLQGVQASIATNLDSIKKTIANLDKRLAQLDRK